jgi:hypothetical protein
MLEKRNTPRYKYLAHSERSVANRLVVVEARDENIDELTLIKKIPLFEVEPKGFGFGGRCTVVFPDKFGEGCLSARS